MLRFDHVGVVVDDLDAAVAFFLALGFEREGGTVVEGETVDRINGLDGVRAELVMVRTPDGTGKLEIIKYHAPADTNGAGHPLPANRAGFRHICIEVEDLDGIVEGFRAEGFDTVGDVQDYGNVYRLCYFRGPEGLIVELAGRPGGDLSAPRRRHGRFRRQPTAGTVPTGPPGSSSLAP
jgi:catechol 2,3-dioxygenase-like lactoylglutathione lyase family enzyme